MQPTPTPFGLNNDGGTGISPLDMDFANDIILDNYINGYNFIEGTAVFDFVMWMLVLVTVIAGIWMIIKYWQTVQ
jgi:hypothetical protein